MADEAAPKSQDAATKQAGSERTLLVLIASNPDVMDEVLTALLDIGVTGATLVESKGMAAVLREEMPIFAGLASLLPDATGSRMLFSITTLEQANQTLDYIEKEFREGSRPIAVAVPVARATGLKR